MKYLVLIASLIFSTISFAECIDFSGKYQTVDSNNQVIVLTLVQTQCAQLEFTYDYGQGVVFGKSMTLDGQQRVVVDIPTYKSTEADRWDGDQIVMEGVVHNIQFKEDSTYKGRTFFDTDGKLVEHIQNYDDKDQPTWEAKAVYTKLP